MRSSSSSEGRNTANGISLCECVSAIQTNIDTHAHLSIQVINHSFATVDERQRLSQQVTMQHRHKYSKFHGRLGLAHSRLGQRASESARAQLTFKQTSNMLRLPAKSTFKLDCDAAALRTPKLQQTFRFQIAAFATLHSPTNHNLNLVRHVGQRRLVSNVGDHNFVRNICVRSIVTTNVTFSCISPDQRTRRSAHQPFRLL
jgi:hypothetical protein